MKLILKADSRDKEFYRMFGSSFDLPDEYNADSPLRDTVQAVGNVQCVAITTADIFEDFDKKREFNVDDLWARVPKTQFGSDPRDVIKEAVKNGMLPNGTSTREKLFQSYWSALSGPHDYFDNVRSAIYLAKNTILGACYWHSEWLNTTILPEGNTPLNGHAFSIEGWKQINGEPHLIIEAWLGYKQYMSRHVFNEAMKPYGMQSWVLSTNEIDEKRKKTILETIKDLCINAIIVLNQLIFMKQEEVKDTLPPNKDDMEITNDLEILCEAIMQYEGWKEGEIKPIDS